MIGKLLYTEYRFFYIEDMPDYFRNTPPQVGEW